MISTPISPEFIHGAIECETTSRGLRPHRLPQWVRSHYADQQLLSKETQPSGVRILVETTAQSIALHSHPSYVDYLGAPRPRGAIDLVIGGELIETAPFNNGDATSIDLTTGSQEFVPGDIQISAFDNLPSGLKTVELWLPHNESIELVELRSDAPLLHVSPTQPRWLHHGSSISHGSNATSPARIWPAVAARKTGVALHNLGFGGSALVDPFMARVIRDSPADIISVKFGINVVNLDGMRLRTFIPAVQGFIDTIRDGHPNTPLLLISSVFCGIHEHTSGPLAFDPESFGSGQVRFIATGEPGDKMSGRLDLSITREAMADIVSRREDPNLHYLDGTALYSEMDAEALPLADRVHPDTASHELIGQRFAQHITSAHGPFSNII